MPGEGKANRLRGTNYERELVRQAERKGLEAMRMWGSDGRSAGLHPEVDIMVEGVPLQAKRQKGPFSERYKPNTEAVVGQVIRADKDISYVVLEWDAFLDLLLEFKELEAELQVTEDEADELRGDRDMLLEKLYGMHD